MDVRLLGHLEVEVSGEAVRFEGVKQRRLFAMLALRAPDAVSADELVEALPGPLAETVGEKSASTLIETGLGGTLSAA
jgi:DNA-binding SARP family transcriptional activator